MFDSLVLCTSDVLEIGERRLAGKAVCVLSLRRLCKAYANKSYELENSVPLDIKINNP